MSRQHGTPRRQDEMSAFDRQAIAQTLEKAAQIRESLVLQSRL